MRLRTCLALLAVAAASVAPAAPAAAETVKFGSFTAHVSSPGNPGSEESYDRALPGFYVDAATPVSDHVTVLVHTPTQHQAWAAVFAAPNGVPPAPGVYENAGNYSLGLPPDRPGMNVWGPYCQGSLTGRFTVFEAVYGSFAWVERFHATYEQTCDATGVTTAGEVDINNGPDPGGLVIDKAIDPTGLVEVGGSATVSGTIGCNRTTWFQLDVQVNQATATHGGPSAWTQIGINCWHWVPHHWVATATSETPGKLFRSGNAGVTIVGRAYNPVTDREFLVTAKRGITLQ